MHAAQIAGIALYIMFGPPKWNWFPHLWRSVIIMSLTIQLIKYISFTYTLIPTTYMH